MRKYGIEDEMQHHERFVVLLENIGEIYADDIMKLDHNYVDTLIKYRDIIILMDEFFADMQRNNRKDTKYSHTKLRRLLEETEFLPGRTS